MTTRTKAEIRYIAGACVFGAVFALAFWWRLGLALAPKEAPEPDSGPSMDRPPEVVFERGEP
jgi:hypothetical protein